MSYRTSIVVASKSPSLVIISALAKTYIYNNKILTKSFSLLLTAIVQKAYRINIIVYTRAKCLLTIFVVFIDYRELIGSIVAILNGITLWYQLVAKYLLYKVICIIVSRVLKRVLSLPKSFLIDTILQRNLYITVYNWEGVHNKAQGSYSVVYSRSSTFLYLDISRLQIFIIVLTAYNKVFYTLSSTQLAVLQEQVQLYKSITSPALQPL